MALKIAFKIEGCLSKSRKNGISEWLKSSDVK